MAQLRSLLTWQVSARDPFFLAIVVVIILFLTVLLAAKPRLYLPLILATVPFPKLFTITRYDIGDNYITAAPGFSLVDMVLAAGIAAFLIRRWRRPVVRESRVFGRAMLYWSASVVVSCFLGLILWSGAYKPVYTLYAVRYLLTLATFGVGAQYAYAEWSEGSLRKLLHRLAVIGNATILLGLVYYAAFGSANAGARGVQLLLGEDARAALFRTYFWFFDGGNDVGFYAALIGILDIILLSDRRLIGLRLLTATGLIGCVATILLIGERADVLVFGVAVGYFLWETSKLRHRSVRVSIVFQVVCFAAVLLAVFATMSFIAPEYINQKFQDSVGIESDPGTSLTVMRSVGVPEGLANKVAYFPIGDMAGRLSLNVAGVWFFFAHPIGVGFWGELFVAGFYSHHEMVKIAIEQGIPGFVLMCYLLVTLKRLLWSGRNLPGAAGQLNVLLRTISMGLLAAMIGANTVLLGMKFNMVYFTLVGVWSVIPRAIRPASAVAIESSQPRRVTASV